MSMMQLTKTDTALKSAQNTNGDIYAKVPQELKDCRRWVCWRYEIRNDKQTKVLYQISGQNAKSNDPTTWGTFQDCVIASSRFDGIGFVLGDSWAGCDLDGCIDDTGNLSQFAQAIIERLNSYTEISPSGKGVKIFMRGKLPSGRRRDDKQGIELYDCVRFFTVTGVHLDGTPLTVNERSAELEALHSELFPAKIASPKAQPQPVAIDDRALLDIALRANDGGKFARLWNGDTSDYANNASNADQALVNKLAFYCGGDAVRIDRLFRQSGLMREKWDIRHSGDGRTYGQMTIDTALATVTEFYTPTKEGKKKSPKKPKTADYIAALANLGYTFRLNLCNDDIEVNGEIITDPLRAEIRSKMRDAGFKFVNVAEDAYTAHAYQNRYHPVRDYLSSLGWDGIDHIARLAAHFTDKYQMFDVWLKRWLVGSVAKAYQAEQNPMLVLDGAQGLGKSHFVRWLMPPVLFPKYFYEGAIAPDNKDSHVTLMSTWLWEVSELGSTTRRADIEALKAFITKRSVTIRKPYGRYPTIKPALASFIGTINNDIGFLDDPSGYRRFNVCHITALDWGYSGSIDVNQVWAQATHLYFAGEPWQLSPVELQRASVINADYELDDQLSGLLQLYFKIDPSDKTLWVATGDILAELIRCDIRNVNPKALAHSAKRLGLERSEGINSVGQRARGYAGIAKMPKLTEELVF